MLRTAAPYVLVSDIRRAVRFYGDELGFAYDRLWGDPPTFAMVQRDGVILMLKESLSDPIPVSAQGGAWDAYVWVEDADALFEEFAELTVTVEYPPQDFPDYKMREFAIADPDDNVIAFGSDLE